LQGLLEIAFNKNDIDNGELDRLKNLTPLEFYNMGATQRLMCNLSIANAEFKGLIDSINWYKQVGYTEEKIKWVGRKGNKVEYFSSHREIESKFNIHINQVRRMNGSDRLDGWIFDKTNTILIKDYKGNILKVK
jgi:hypothetical protein